MQVKKIIGLIILVLGFSLNQQSYAAPQDTLISQQSRLQRIEAYFNKFRTLKAKFTQLNPDGSQAEGIFYLWRPGRMRLNYESHNGVQKDPKLMHILLADGDTIYDHNPEMDETTEIPVDATPAGFILRENIKFQGDIQVAKLEESKGLLFLSLQKKDDPDAGMLTLIFNPEPLALIEWEILDSQKMPTRVLLDAIETGVKMSPNLFKVNF